MRYRMRQQVINESSELAPVLHRTQAPLELHIPEAAPQALWRI